MENLQPLTVSWVENRLGDKEGQIWFLQLKVMGLESSKKIEIFIHPDLPHNSLMSLL